MTTIPTIPTIDLQPLRDALVDAILNGQADAAYEVVHDVAMLYRMPDFVPKNLNCNDCNIDLDENANPKCSVCCETLEDDARGEAEREAKQDVRYDYFEACATGAQGEEL